MTDQWHAAATVVAIGAAAGGPPERNVMRRKALVLTLFVALVVALTPTGVAAAASGPGTQSHPAKQLSPAERIAVQEDARRNDPRIYEGWPVVNRIAWRHGQRQADSSRAHSQNVARPSAKQLSPAERIALQEDARYNDPRIFGSSPAESTTRSVVEIVSPGGFDWADAGVGAAAAFALLLLALGVTLLVRNRQLSRA